MTSRLREILTPEEYELFMRTGELYDDEPVEVKAPEIPAPVLFRPYDIKPEVWASMVGRTRDFPVASVLTARTMRAFDTFVPETPKTVERAAVTQTCAVVSPDDDGYCYLKLVKPDMQLAVAGLLGAWPKLMQLLMLPGSVLLGGDVLAVLGCRVNGNKVHVSDFDVVGLNFAGLLSKVPADRLPDWAYDVLADRPVPSIDLGSVVNFVVGGEPVSKNYKVGSSYESLIVKEYRDSARKALGETASLSQVFAFPTKYYVDDVINRGFTVERGCVRFTVGVGTGIRLFILMRLMLDDLGDLKTYPILRLVKSSVASLTEMGLSDTARPADTALSAVFQGFSRQRRAAGLDYMLPHLQSFEARVVCNLFDDQVDALRDVSVYVGGLAPIDVWLVLEKALRGVMPSGYDVVLRSEYVSYAQLFNGWVNNVFLGVRVPALLEQYGIRASFIARQMNDLLNHLGVSGLEFLRYKHDGIEVKAAEYTVLLPIPGYWYEIQAGAKVLSLCSYCGGTHAVLRAQGKRVYPCDGSDSAAYDLDCKLLFGFQNTSELAQSVEEP